MFRGITGGSKSLRSRRQGSSGCGGEKGRQGLRNRLCVQRVCLCSRVCEVFSKQSLLEWVKCMRCVAQIRVERKSRGGEHVVGWGSSLV